MEKPNKLHGIINIRNIFLCEVGIGISVNTIFLLFLVLKFLLQHRIKPIDLTIGFLALIHILMLIIMGFIATDIFESQESWSDIKCKSLMFLYRFLRGFSICAACLLSVLQAVTLSPRSSCLARFKHKSPHHSLSALLFLWVFYMSFSAHLSISAVPNSNATSRGLTFITESCTILPMSYFLRHLFSILGIFRDVFLMGLMALSSGYTVALLYRHRKQCQKIHSTSRSPKASPEQRATLTILLLLSFFVVMYSLDCMITNLRTMHNTDLVHRSIQAMMANGYATISPLVFMSREKQIIDFLKSFWGRRVDA